MTYVLVCSSIYGEMYMGHSDDEAEMKEKASAIDTYTTGNVRVVPYENDDIDELIRDTEKFNSIFKEKEQEERKAFGADDNDRIDDRKVFEADDKDRIDDRKVFGDEDEDLF